jgi:BMFP domain-containing protein YqiC
MSDNPFLSKMDALLKKHRGDDGPEASSGHVDARIEHAAPPDAWLPVLTQVIERGTPPVVPVVAASPPATPPPLASPAVEPATRSTMDAPIVSDTLAEQLMSELAPRLSEVMEKQVAAELRKNLDQTVATLLSQLDVNVREIVRDAVAEKLKQPRDPSA